MDIANKAKYFLCGMADIINEKTLNLIVCESYNKMIYEKEKYEEVVFEKIKQSNIDKTVFKRGGIVLWKSKSSVLRGYSPSIVILIGLDKNSEEYKQLSPNIMFGSKIYLFA